MYDFKIKLGRTVLDTKTYVSPKKQLFDLEVKGQGPTKVITVRDTLSYSHAPTYQISLTYLERQKSYDSDKLRWEEAEEEVEAAEEEKIRLKQYVSLRSKGRHKYNKYKEALTYCLHNKYLVVWSELLNWLKHFWITVSEMKIKNNQLFPNFNRKKLLS